MKKGPKSRGKFNLDMKKKRKKKLRMVAHPVDQSLPLSVKVLIGELLCVLK